MDTRTCTRIDPTTEQKCSNEAAEKHQWCKPCQAKYKREYSALVPGMAAVRGHAKGVESLRNVLVTEFARLGSGMFSGIEVAHLIAGTPAPRYDSEA